MNNNKSNMQYKEEIAFLNNLGFIVVPYNERYLASEIFYKGELVGYLTFTDDGKVKTNIDSKYVTANYTHDILDLGMSIRELCFKSDEQSIKLYAFHNESNSNEIITVLCNHKNGYTAEYNISFEQNEIASEALLSNDVEISEKGSESETIKVVETLFPDLVNYYLEKHNTKTKKLYKND